MGIPSISIVAVSLIFAVSCSITKLGEGKAYESPEYTVMHSESDFEVRHYRESVWMSAPADEISFEKATRDGFHRLFQFIEGANLNFSRIPMTVPVLTSVVPGAGPLQSSAYNIKFYLPVKFQGTPPVPLPELNLKPDSRLRSTILHSSSLVVSTRFGLLSMGLRLLVANPVLWPNSEARFTWQEWPPLEMTMKLRGLSMLVTCCPS